MSGLEINTKKLGEIYEEWRGNKSCYDNGRPVFEADELLDFAQFCLKHEANVIPTGERQSNIPDVKASALEKLKIAKKALNDIYNFDRDMEFEYGDPGERAMRALEAIDRIDGF